LLGKAPSKIFCDTQPERVQAMPEVFLLIAFMVATLVLLAGLMVIFRGWMEKRDSQPGGNASSAPSAGGH
jgi:hypothetical protein